MTLAPFIAVAIAASLTMPAIAAPLTTPKDAPLVHLASSKTAQHKGLAGTAWILDTVQGEVAPADSPIDLSFSGASVSGSDGCNRLNGNFKEKADGTIAVGPFASTMMACLDDKAGAFSKVYIDALSKVSSYTLSNGKLTLKDASGVASAVYHAQDVGLRRTAWKVTGYNNGKNAVESSAASEKMSLSLGAHGKLIGNAGCGPFNGKYRFDKATGMIAIAINRAVPSCKEFVSTQPAQDAMIKALSNATRYTRTGNRLELRSDDGAAQLLLNGFVFDANQKF